MIFSKSCPNYPKLAQIDQAKVSLEHFYRHHIKRELQSQKKECGPLWIITNKGGILNGDMRP